MEAQKTYSTTRQDQGPLVRVEDLHVHFVGGDHTVYAVNGVNFTLDRGEVLGILGESGSGKSVTLRAMMRLLPPRKTRISGRVVVDGRDVTAMGSGELRRLRGNVVSLIFQEPMTALDPVYTVSQQICETIVTHEGCSWQDARARALELLNLVQIPSAERRLDAYPHELSGGLRQRVMIALALSCRPSLLLADEPTTALDATVQTQILLLLRQLQEELGMSVIFVTHDLGVAVEVSHRIAVMYAGRFVESGPTAEVVQRPRHPYTEGLMNATVLNTTQDQLLKTIPGSPPNLSALPPGCSFTPRCGYAKALCSQAMPDERHVGPDHYARCIVTGPDGIGRG